MKAGDWVNNAYRAGYQKKGIRELLQAIDDCTSLSQLFALIQNEQIEIQMHAQSDASNVRPRKLSTQEYLKSKQLPLDRLKEEVKKAVCGGVEIPMPREDDSEIVKKIWATETLSELFALLQKEHIVIQMHAQSGASNLSPKTLKPKPVDAKISPFERFKAEVVKSLSEQQK